MALSVLLITIIAGVFTLILLSFGVADPPRAGELVWQTDTINDWASLQSNSESQRYIAPIPLPQSPFTLENIARNDGAHVSAWGFWLRTANGPQTFLVSSDDNTHWAQFIHIRTTTNKLHLHIQDNQSATFCINDEIAWKGVITPLTEWGAALHGSADVSWQNIHLYAGK